jgi:uncharacterized protein
MDERILAATRREKDAFFKSHPMSPLTPEQQAAFNGLRYYDYNAALDLRVTVALFPKQESVLFETTTGDARTYTRFGEFYFDVDGVEARLTIYETDNGFFLPFVDAGANRETYGAGRYLEPELLDDDTFHIDFNLAYSPYCAYGDGWSCPLTPYENRLDVHIRAGEMKPEGAWVT